jgi:hypothetical protein
MPVLPLGAPDSDGPGGNEAAAAVDVKTQTTAAASGTISVERELTP